MIGQEKETPEHEYLQNLACCRPPTNPSSDCICIYCGPCTSPCVHGLMLQQLQKGGGSMETGGCKWVYCHDESCYQCLFPCVISQNCCKTCSLSSAGTDNNARAISMEIVNVNTARDIRSGLIFQATGKPGGINNQLDVVSKWHCISCNNAAYVIKKHQENRAETSKKNGQKGFSPFAGPATTGLVPGTKHMEFTFR